MTVARSFLQDLEEAVARGTPDKRLNALWHAADLLTTGQYSEDDIWTFGEVIGCLAEEIELAARAQLSAKLSRTDNAPFNIIKKLALDDSIEVAGPVLRHSSRIDEKTLVATARSKSQEHLLAIANRKVVPESVTDVLVSRGNRDVARSIAGNTGARFSNAGFLQLVTRSERDTMLTTVVGRRLDIPRHLFQQLIAKASDDVRRKLEDERPELAMETRWSVANVAGALQAKFGPASKDYFDAKKAVVALSRYGSLTEREIREYAQMHKLEATTAGLALLYSLPVDVIERALIDPSRELILILARASNFSWETTMSLLFLGAPNHQISASNLEQHHNDFFQLTVETAQSVLQMFRSRKNASSDASSMRRLPALHAR